MYKGEYVFLSPDWVYRATKVIQGERATDRGFANLVSDLSFDLTYIVTDIPKHLKVIYGGSQLIIFVRLDKGAVKRLVTQSELPKKEAYFTVTSQYKTFKSIYLGEINPATAFVNRQLKVEPLSRVYKSPRFSARSITTGNRMLQILKQVSTSF